MVQTLFDVDQPLAKHATVTYNLQPSQQLVNIRSVLASRKRKSNILSSSSSSSPVCSPVDSSDDVGKKQKHVYDDTYSGLPSPPVESSLDDFPTMSKHKSTQSPPLTPNTAFSTCSSVTTEINNENHSSLMEETEDGLLSTESIKSKLAALREEKHNMFQLLKRLVEQEEQQKQQQQQQQDLKKKRPSRWSSPTVSPFSYQRPSPLSLHQINNDNNSITSRHSTASASSFHTHAGSHVYLGGQQSNQQSPYLY